MKKSVGFKAPKWGTKPIVKSKVGRRKIRAGGKVGSAALAKVLADSSMAADISRLPYDVASILTDPCGVMYYNNRVAQAAEYRPFYEDELATLQIKLTAARLAALALAGSIQANYEETKDKIGFHRGEAMEMVRQVRYGGGGGDLQMAHDFVYGDGVYWEPLEDIINWAAGDIRSDLRTAISAVFATEREADKLLNAIDGLYSRVMKTVGRINRVLTSMETWNGNALKLAQSFCSEANETRWYLNRREQRFRTTNDLEWRGGIGYDRPVFWRPINEPCDKWCRDHTRREDCQIWPSMHDEAFEEKLTDRASGLWPAYPTYRGCVKADVGTPRAQYICGEMPLPDARGVASYVTSGLMDEVEDLLNYDADALFRESKTVMTSAWDAVKKVTNLLNGFKSTLNSTGMDIAMGVASSLCTFGVGAGTCYRILDGHRNQAVRGLRDAAGETNALKSRLTDAIDQHTAAKTMWKRPTTPWRIQANASIATLRSLNGPIQSPWTNPVSVSACQTIFPKIPMSCLDKMISPSCGRIEISRPPGPTVLDSDMRVFRWDDDSGGGRAGSDLVGGGKPIFETETEFGYLGPVDWYGEQKKGIKPWQVALLLTGGFGLYMWSRK